jgi:hypothetical protein
MNENNEIILNQPDNSIQLEVRLENETVWLSQAQMTELFQTTRNNISMHISNIFKEGELEKNVVCKDFLHTTQHGAINVKTFTRSHDRFIFIDNDVYHIGASLKDLGKKMVCFLENGIRR